MAQLYPQNPNVATKVQGSTRRVETLDQAYIAHYTETVLAADDDKIKNDQTLGDGVTTTITTFDGQPDVPRNLTVVGTAGISGNVVITGTDAGNAVISETIVANGATPVIGLKAFRRVTSIVFPARTAPADVCSVGIGSVLGLSNKLTHNTVLRADLNNVVEAVAPTVTKSSTVLALNTVLLNSALTDADVVDVYYLV